MTVKNNLGCWLLFGLLVSQSAWTLHNPDQITVYFPPIASADNLGRNVATVLSLQLAQTARSAPWPDNPQQHDFGQGLIRWGNEPITDYSIAALNKTAQSVDLLAQIVVVGKAKRFGPDLVVELDVLLPEYQRATSPGCDRNRPLRCDYRQRNFEIWQLRLANDYFELDVPNRYFRLSTIVLKPEVVKRFAATTGLPIHATLTGGEILGHTDAYLQFVEFNKKLPGAPTKLRSGGVEGYVSLPELSNETSEFAKMVGGIWQVFRGDWQQAHNSFSRVIDNPQTRVPLQVDALLYRGMTKFRRGENGLSDIRKAVQLAPFDHTALRYLLMAHLASGTDRQLIASLVQANADLFPPQDTFVTKLNRWLATSDD